MLPEKDPSGSAGASDRCIYDDVALKASILERRRKVANALRLLPEAGRVTAENSEIYGRLLHQIDEMQNGIALDEARTDFNVFAESVAVDDETGLPLKQAPIHRRWAELCSQHKRLIIWSHISSGKTTQLSILRTVWELGRDPSLRVCVLSNTSSIAGKILKAIAGLIKDNEKIREIFPHLIPHPDGPWTSTELKVVGNNSKDPSVRAVGVHGALTSARVDHLIVDDILDPENCETEAARKKLMNWYKAVAVGRLTKRARILVVGTAYHPRDLLHELSRQKVWRWFRFPILSASNQITWPEAWSRERIAQMREELGPSEYARQLLCKARDDDEARFKQEWIDKALEKGNGMVLVHRIDELSDAEREDLDCYTGVDLAVSKKRKADKTAMFSFAEDDKGNRRLLSISKGKFTGPEIVDRVIDVHERYGSLVAVENNAAQDFILQFARDKSAVPVVPHTTTRSKRDPVMGVEGLAIELANGKWAIPNDDGRVTPEIDEFITEMLFYSPGAHTGDSLMAAYFAREIARKLGGDKSVAQISVRTIGASDMPVNQEEAQVYREGPDLKKLFDVPPDQIGQ